MGDVYYDSDAYNTLMVIYLIIAGGCIIFFFVGVCALLCCCRDRFRGITRRGYVIRDNEQQTSLIAPGTTSIQTPHQPPPAGFNYPHDAPPPYGNSPPAKY